MAENFWRGDALAVAQVNTITVGGTPAAGQVYSVTINRKVVSYTAIGGDTNAIIAAALQVALAAATPAEFTEVTWTYAAAGVVVTGTATTAGVPFTNTSGATGTGTCVTATATANTGPNSVDNAANWSLNAVPVNTDDVIIQGTDSSLLYGLTALSGVTPNSFQVRASFTGRIGLPDNNPAGYVEYRTKTLSIAGNSPVTIGEGEGQGSTLIRLAAGTGSTVVVVESTGAAPNDAAAAFMISNSGATNTLAVLSGNVAVAGSAGETATFSTIQVGGGSASNLLPAPVLSVGFGATIGTSLTLNSGSVLNRVTCPQLYQIGGTYIQDAGTLTNVQCSGGTVVYQSTGTTTLATFRNPGATCDCSQDPRARTFTNCSFTAGAILNDPSKSITFTNAGTWDSASLAASATSIGTNFTLQRV